jgi:hypothetical protein
MFTSAIAILQFMQFFVYVYTTALNITIWGRTMLPYEKVQHLIVVMTIYDDDDYYHYYYYY